MPEIRKRPSVRRRQPGNPTVTRSLIEARSISSVISGSILAKPTMAFRYKFFVSVDGKNWKEVPTSGEFSNIMHNPLPQTVAFNQKVQARFIKLEATTPDAAVAKVNMDEIGVMVAP